MQLISRLYFKSASVISSHALYGRFLLVPFVSAVDVDVIRRLQIDFHFHGNIVKIAVNFISMKVCEKS